MIFFCGYYEEGYGVVGEEKEEGKPIAYGWVESRYTMAGITRTK